MQKLDSGVSKQYRAEDITVLEGLEPVRKRPAMYIGSTSSVGLHHLIYESVDNAIDEAMNGFCDFIEVELREDGAVRVSDNGRGIPIDIHPQTKKSALETVMTVLHAGGKFGGKGYKVSGGLHGVGISVVNALSSWMRAEVCRDGKKYSQEYRRGIPKTKVVEEGKCQTHGTTQIFKPDEEIFEELNFSGKTIFDHLRRQAYLTPRTHIRIIDRRSGREGSPSLYNFYFEGGINAYLEQLARGNEYEHAIPFTLSEVKDDVSIDIAFRYVRDVENIELAFANNIVTPQGGTHVTGFRSALTRAFNKYAETNNYFSKGSERFVGDDIQEGLLAIVAVRLGDPQFEGQTKSKLGNREVRGLVETLVAERLEEYLKRYPQDASAIVQKLLLSQKARQKASAVRQTILRKGALAGLRLPGKLTDCLAKDPADSEIFMVEGDSAGGCFDGNTTVALADGRSLPFKELAREYAQGIINYCYTINAQGSVEIREIHNPHLTKKNAEVMKVILDNNEDIICTPEHKFMLADGSFKEARALTPMDSLMPLYRQYSKVGKRITIEGYELVFDPALHRWIFTHLLSDCYNLERRVYAQNDGAHRHHKDFNKRNNNPDNIVRLTSEAHLQLHREMVAKTLHRPDVKEKVAALHKTEEFRNKIREKMLSPKMRKLLQERAKRQWENEAYKAYMVEKFLAFYQQHVDYRQKSRAILVQAQKEYWSSKAHHKLQAERVKKYFQEHPEKRSELSLQAKMQWQDDKLKAWRSEMTKKQWTAEFRKKRLEAYNLTYYHKAMKALHQLYKEHGKIAQELYEGMRSEVNDKNLLRFDTILQRFFEGNAQKLAQTVQHYNHRIKAIVRLNKKVDVYDLEVPETHNFALASGVFVHNSAKQARDPNTQAILPLRGKILNVEKARIDKMLTSQEIQAIIVALGTAISEEFNLEKLRYHKIIIMTDADIDGSHIKTLLLTLFFRYFQPVIEQGYLYVAQPPLYRISKGKQVVYAYSDEDKVSALLQFKEGDPVDIQRYKGLGEMNPEQLWETTMDPQKRILHQVKIEDALEADKIFDVLMGDEVKPRRKFIQAHSRQVANLDI